MKTKFKIIIIGVLLILLVVVSMVRCVKNPKSRDADTVITKVETKVDKKQQKKIDELEKEIKANKEKEAQEKYEQELRRIKLETLQNPTLIQNEMENVGKLLVYKGKANYNNAFDESKFLKPKKITVDLTYRFGIAMDLKHIEIVEFIEDVVVIKIHKDQLKVEYVELNEENIAINEETKWLASEFTKDDLNNILAIAKNTTLGRIEGNKDIFDKGIESLKVNLNEIILKLGYKRVVYEVI